MDILSRLPKSQQQQHSLDRRIDAVPPGWQVWLDEIDGRGRRIDSDVGCEMYFQEWAIGEDSRRFLWGYPAAIYGHVDKGRSQISTSRVAFNHGASNRQADESPSWAWKPDDICGWVRSSFGRSTIKPGAATFDSINGQLIIIIHKFQHGISALSSCSQTIHSPKRGFWRRICVTTLSWKSIVKGVFWCLAGEDRQTMPFFASWWMVFL